MKKKLQAILFCGILLTALIAGCGSTEPKTESKPKPGPESESEPGPEAKAHYTAGTYSAEAKGMRGPVKVSVTLSDSAITDVKVTEQTETYGLAWGLKTSPVEVLPGAIVAAQSLGVDSVSGATMTSNAIKQAVADCVTQAGGDAAALQNAPVEKAEPKDETYDTEVAVVGAGAAGLSAALEAVNLGAKVIIMEAQGVTGGATTCSGGKFMAAGTSWQEAQDQHDTPEMMYDYVKSVSKDAVDENMFRPFADNSAATLKWLADNGVQIQDVEPIHSSITPMRVHNVKGGGGMTDGHGGQYTVPLTDDFEKAGGQIIYNCRAGKLLTDESGKVTGVEGTRPDGSTVTVKASKGVILATGGFAQNKEMMSRYESSTGSQYFAGVPKTCQGDGLKMASALGARVYYDPFTFVTYCSFTCGVGVNEESGLVVNCKGERVVNEWSYQYHVAQAIKESGCNKAFYIASANDPNPTVQYGLTLESTPHAASAEELAGMIEVDPEVLKKTVERYNELCAKGSDDDFGKPAKYMIPLEGELYAIAYNTSCSLTFGGLVMDTSARVLKEDDQPIPGLYAAGEVAFTGLVGGEYPGCGTCIGTAVYYGRIAAQSAVDGK